MSAADRVSTGSMLALSFGTGVLDAATYLGLHGVFTANMTGNVVFVGLGLAGGNQVPLLRAVLALGGFVLGAVAIGWSQRGREVRANADTVAALSFVLAGLIVATAAVVLQVVHLSVWGLDALTAGVAFAMGAQAVAARRVGVPDVSTVVVTSTIAGLAADGPWTGNRTGWLETHRRLAAVLSMGLGAVAGGFLLRFTTIAVPVGLAAGLLLVVGALSVVRVARTHRAARTATGERSAVGAPGAH